MAATDKTLEEKIAEIDNDDPVREILEMLLQRIKDLEIQVRQPIRPGGRT